MKVNVAEFIAKLLAAAWRRRVLIVVPIVTFLVLSAVAAKVWPRAYASSMLIMLQERGNPNPLRSAAEIFRDLRLKADEIEALLKSDRVLASAVLDLRRGSEAPTRSELEKAVRDLKDALFVKMVGSDFIEIELRSSNPNGLGSRLSTIATRFLESFLSREDTLKTARQFAKEQRRRDVENAKTALDDWTARNAALTSLDATADAAQQEKQRLEARLAQATLLHDALQRRTGVTIGASATPLGLIAPEHIRIIDEPRDPVSPVTSVLKILVACIGAGIGLGVGLAALAEQLDDRIHDAKELERMTGARVIIGLPKLDTQALVAAASRREPVSRSARPHAVPLRRSNSTRLASAAAE